ncbi:M56 family metallopeptidase [Ekhidna sp.]|uniref:M56 family metallopeptidase n=1 Tax=Ekhidna sp. TaxID=2608089 RepID=UPI003299CFCE
MESYLLQSSVTLAGFYLLFRLLIIRENNQQMKRFMGLFIAIFCACFLVFPTPQLGSSQNFPLVMQGAIESASAIQSTLSYATEEKVSPWIIIYTAGVCIFSIRFLVGIFGIIQIYANSEVSKRWGFALVETEASISPFSFFNYLFIKKGDAKKSALDPIILHEQYHRDQLHSVDAMLLEILTILFWFNPFIWLLQRDIKASHEFLADDYVIRIKGFDKLAYQNLLFEERTGISFMSANYLSNQTSLKQRFNMMEKRKTHSKASFLRAGIVLCTTVLVTFMTSFSIPSPFRDNMPDIKLFTSTGEIDEKKGISKTTDKIYLRMIPEKDSKFKAYRLSQVKVTFVSDGVGLWTMEGKDVFDFGVKLSEVEGKCALVFEVKEYMTQNKKNQVEKVKLEKPFYLNATVY